MSFLVIPNEAYSDRAIVWIAAINENFDPAATVLEYGSDQKSLNDGWNKFVTADGKNSIRYQRVTLDNLAARKWYSLVLRVNGDLKADGSVITLPDRLPNAGDRPFTVLLGSCYFGREDKAGAVGQTFLQLPFDAKPEIKILCGDQVYLDNPPQDFIIPHGHDWLQARSFKTYADSWTQWNIGGGFNQMLKHEANFFSSDDHEYWNNAPDVGLNVPVFTSSQSGRDSWWNIGHEMFRIFQTTPGPPTIFKVDPLSFCLADTRINRGSGSGGRGDVMLQADFEKIGEWTANLTGPGVLVVGQPFFDEPGSTFGRIEDCGLPDFTKQYELLKQYLRASQHTIVILTGDVHYGRVAVANLRPELGTKLYEVISSPLQLVPHGGGNYKPAPQVFGAVSSQPEFSLHRNHFLTIDFMAPSAQRASMLVKFWPIIQNGTPLQSQIIGGGPIELI
jgi:hypothetical protein